MTAHTRSITALTVLCLWGIGEAAGQSSSVLDTTAQLASAQAPARVGVYPLTADVAAAAGRSNFETVPADFAERAANGLRPRTPNSVTVGRRSESPSSRDGCQHAITLWDSYGDGWTGGFIDVYVGGTLAMGGVTLSGGYGPETVYVDVTTGAAITTVWTPGEYPTEASYCIYNALDAELGCDGAGGTEPVGLALTADCVRTGACCDPYDGTCTDGVDIDDCTSPMEFTLGTLCADLSVTCGEPGACCDDIADECTIEYHANCPGRFIAGGTCDDFDPDCGDYLPCAHTITVASSSHHGWNQGHSYVDVYVDGVLTLAGLTVQDHAPDASYTFLAEDGATITTEFTWADGWTEPLNAEYCVYDGSGALLGCDGLGDVRPTGMTVAAVCQGTGACCDPYNGTCTDGVDVWACLPPMQYTAGTLCAELPTPCGNPGACCDQETGVCTEEYELNCDGRFLPGVTCAEAEFVPPCGVYNACNVLIVPAESESEYFAGNNNFMDLLADVTYSSVDYMDGTVTTPTLAQLQAYDLVVTYADSSYADKHLMGDVLADYVDSGGRVIIGNYALYTQGTLSWLDGRIVEQYSRPSWRLPTTTASPTWRMAQTVSSTTSAATTRSARM